MARIFLCHASEDRAQVREVYHQLKALGFAPWLDEVDILPGQDWNYEIEQALNQATQHWYTGSTHKRVISVRPGHRVYESRVD